MGQVKTDIRQLSKDAGGKARAAKAAEDWFNTSRKSVRENAVARSAGSFEPGKIYVFRYENPVVAEWWDSNPVVLALNRSDTGNDMGINLNMLPVPLKEQLLDHVYEQYKGFIDGQTRGAKEENAKAQARLSFSYQGARTFLKKFGFDFAIRQYSTTRKSKQAVVSYEHWGRIALCDFLELNNSSVGAIRAAFRKHLNK
tara:strand:+ start:685 stop:1281 length:597 start_codon:yes stop_codon:yes gene_type:complete